MQTVDMHIHTNYSYDGYLSLGKLDEACSRRQITAVAITDHNEIAGALEAARLNGKGVLRTRIIVGEEIKTTQGEIVGLFLKERIPPEMSLSDTMKVIHHQGGLVYLNHPFGYGRRAAKLSLDDLDSLWGMIDIVEIFNGRNWNRRANDLAKKLALKHNKPGAVGTDAHSPWEVGRSFVSMEDFDGPEKFLAALRHATYICSPCPFAYRLLFKARKLLLQRPLPRE